MFPASVDLSIKKLKKWALENDDKKVFWCYSTIYPVNALAESFV